MSDFVNKLVNVNFKCVVIQEELKEIIQNFFDDNGGGLILNGVPEFAVINTLESVIPDFDFVLDTNGWQRDFWYYFSYNNKKYVFAGSSYFGTASIEELKNE